MSSTAVETGASDVRRPLRADAQRNYDRIVASARAAFSELGGEAPLEEIAKRAGVGIGTLYRHFPNRLSLLETVYREDVDRLAALAHQLVAERSPWEALETWLSEFSSYAATKRMLFQEIVSVAGRETEVFTHSRAVISEAGAQVIGGAQRAGVIRSDVEASDVTRLVGGCTMMPGADADQRQRMLRLVLDGLRPVAPPAPPD